jgi:hypothetical protein
MAMDVDVEGEFYRIAAELHAPEQHDDPHPPPIDKKVTAFYAVYLTGAAVAYYYIGRGIFRAIFN